MSLPDITKELEEVLNHFEPIAKEAYPDLDRGGLFLTAKDFSRDWLIGQLSKAMEEFRRKRNTK